MNTQILNRISYGKTKESLQKLEEMGLEAYIDWQLNPQTSEDKEVSTRLKKLELKIKKEDRPLEYLDAGIEELWELTENGTPHREKMRPAHEIAAATWVRSVYSQWQLREIMVEFWHNHFNVSIEADERIAITFPLYDQMIRKNCFGNFRVFLEEVAKSPAMLYYLDNSVSKASPANENYARELFELHTLGAEHYLNHLYNRWREVPGATEGAPQGYIDEDVYEAARAFTGWTVADGEHDGKGGRLPDTGKFHYYEGWHDNYQKRVLGTEFDSNQPPMADGQKVLDLLAAHSGTAKFLCTKLCRRLVADEPPQSLIDKAIEVWTKEKDSADQLKKVIRLILLSQEFKDSLGKKLKRPNELVASFLRSTKAEFTPNQNLHWILRQMGYMHFAWPTPTGHPDLESHWLNSNMMLLRWNAMTVLLEGKWHKITQIDILGQTPKDKLSCEQIVDYWLDRIVGRKVEEKTRMRIMNYLSAGGVETGPPFGNEREVSERLTLTIALIGMVPEFQYR